MAFCCGLIDQNDAVASSVFVRDAEEDRSAERVAEDVSVAFD